MTLRASGRSAALALICVACLAPASAQQQMPAVASIGHQVAQIDAAQPRLQLRDRLLTGTSPEGTSVEAYLQGDSYRKIVVEALGETGRTISDFYFERGALIHARVRQIGYKNYPQYDLSKVPPHKHLTIDPTDKILADDAYDFTGGHLLHWTSFGRNNPKTDPEFRRRQEKVLADADLYVRFMNTPPTSGAKSGGAWTCIRGADDTCATFKPDAVR